MADDNSAAKCIHAIPEFPVDDVQRAARWYEDILGWETEFLWPQPENGRTPFYGGVRSGEAVIHLNSSDEDAGRPAKTYVIVTGVDALADAIRDRGGVLDRDPETYDYGMRDFSIHDPDGNLLTFGESVGEV